MIYAQLVILLFTFIFIFIILAHIKKKEPMRTVPRIDRHPKLYVDSDEPNARIPLIKANNVNDEIDYVINLYFDKNNIPTDYAIRKYFDNFVNRGTITEENKMKMKDFCYYLIQFVIPKIPSEENPNPDIEWPYIEFLSNSITSYTIQAGTKTYSPFISYEVTPYDFDELNSPGSSTPGNGANGPGSADSDSNSGANSGNRGSNANSKGSGSGCGCPNACFATLMSSMSNKGGSPSGSPGSDSSSDSNGSSSSYGGVGSLFPGSSSADASAMLNMAPINSGLASTYMRGKGDLRITNEEMKKDIFETWKKQNANNQPANDYITSFIQSYFGIDASKKPSIGKPNDNMMIPTDYGKFEFRDFFKTRTPIDLLHKNKLIDVVYYFMENIVPGLPTDSVPFSYVEWRPIIWSSGSFV